MKTIAIDDYVLDTLMRDLIGRDKSPSAFAVYLFLWRRAREGGSWSTRVSHKGIADETGLSKSAVQAAVRHLNRRKLIKWQLWIESKPARNSGTVSLVALDI